MRSLLLGCLLHAVCSNLYLVAKVSIVGVLKRMTMNSFICICSSLVLIMGFLSCSEKEILTGTFLERYYLSSYFVPQRIHLSSYSRNGVNDIILEGTDKITKETNIAEFTRLSTEYGETGEQEFWMEKPPYSQPYGISAIKAYQSIRGEQIDVSDKFIIAWRDCSNVILSKYSDMNEKVSQKKISELTTHDLKWLRERFSVYHTTPLDGDLYLVMILENGTELSLQLLF